MVIFTEGCSLWYSCAAAKRVESTHTVSAPPACGASVKPCCGAALPVLVPPPQAVTAARASAPPAASSPARLRPLPDLFALTARTFAVMNVSTALWRPPTGGPGGGTSRMGRAYLGAGSRALDRSATAGLLDAADQAVALVPYENGRSRPESRV